MGSIIPEITIRTLSYTKVSEVIGIGMVCCAVVPTRRMTLLGCILSVVSLRTYSYTTVSGRVSKSMLSSRTICHTSSGIVICIAT